MIPRLTRVIVRCDSEGQPHEEADYESRAWVFTWLGMCVVFTYGDVMPYDASAEWGIGA